MTNKLLLNALFTTLLATTSITHATNTDDIISEEIKKQKAISALEFQLQIEKLNTELAKTKKECVKYGGCSDNDDINHTNANKKQSILLQNAAQPVSQKQQKQRDIDNFKKVTSSLKLLAVANNKALFNLRDHWYRQGDVINKNIVVKKITQNNVILQHTNSKEFIEITLSWSSNDASSNINFGK